MGVLSQKAFNANYALKKKYGTYQEYKKALGGSALNNTSEVSITTPTQETSSTQETTTPSTSSTNVDKEGDASYTIDDIIGVAETGELPKEKPKSEWDKYMESATDIYNKGVEENNREAESKVANANAEYREIERNLNEINKANGRANTGYAGDTYIDAYNAYRNSVNDAYNTANKSNNDLYSYYMQTMMSLQDKKQTQENIGREYNDVQSQRMLETIANNVEYGANDKITSENAKELWNYVLTSFDGVENIPSEVKASLESIDGFTEWLKAYNEGDTSSYDKESSKGSEFKLQSVDEEGNASNNGAQVAVVKTKFTTDGDGPEDSSHIGNSGLNNFRISYNGTVYYLETGKNKERASTEAVNVMTKQINNAYGRAPQEGDCCYYNGKIYIVTKKGDFHVVGPREAKKHKEDYSNFETAVKRDLGIA